MPTPARVQPGYNIKRLPAGSFEREAGNVDAQHHIGPRSMSQGYRTAIPIAVICYHDVTLRQLVMCQVFSTMPVAYADMGEASGQQVVGCVQAPFVACTSW